MVLFTNDQLINLAPSLDNVMDLRGRNDTQLHKYLLGIEARIRNIELKAEELDEHMEELLDGSTTTGE